MFILHIIKLDQTISDSVFVKGTEMKLWANDLHHNCRKPQYDYLNKELHPGNTKHMQLALGKCSYVMYRGLWKHSLLSVTIIYYMSNYSKTYIVLMGMFIISYKPYIGQLFLSLFWAVVLLHLLKTHIVSYTIPKNNFIYLLWLYSTSAEPGR